MVRARSAALMPVVTPSRASTLTVNAVCICSALCGAIWPSCEAVEHVLLERHADQAAACVIMNAMSSGVASSAAKTRSPSFSRSSSSTTTTALPAAMSAMARSIGRGCAGRPEVPSGLQCLSPWQQELLDVLGDHVDLEVDGVARALAARGW